MNILKLFCLALPFAGGAALAAGTLEDLAIFKSGMTQGLWRMELLSSNERALTQGASAMGKMGVCIDVARQMSRNNQLDEQSCTPKVLRNDKNGAELEVSCQNGTRSHLKLSRESDQSFLLDSDMTGKDGKTRTLAARYTYEGACKGDSMIQLDKNSAACKQMSTVDVSRMTEMCAKAPEQYRARCEQQMKQMGNLCQ